jgi:hypothetical protein
MNVIFEKTLNNSVVSKCEIVVDPIYLGLSPIGVTNTLVSH